MAISGGFLFCCLVHSQREIDRRPRMDRCGVEAWQRQVVGVEDQADLGAAEDDAVGAVVDGACDITAISLSRELSSTLPAQSSSKMMSCTVVRSLASGTMISTPRLFMRSL